MEPMANRCKHKNTRCFKCHNVGHLAKRRKTKQSSGPSGVKYTEGSSESDVGINPEDMDDLGIYSVMTVNPSKGCFVTVELDGQSCKMQVDTAAYYSIMCKGVYENTLKHIPLQRSTVELRTYAADVLNVCGELVVSVKYQD